MIEQSNKLTKRDKKILIYILASAFIIKIIFALLLQVDIRSDSLDYYNLAKSIVETGTYSLDGKPTAYLVCGYPLFLASIFKIFGDSIFAVKLIQSFLEIFTGLFFFLASSYFFKPRYSLIALAIFTFLPSNLLYSQTILTEPLYGFLFSVIFYYCLKENINKNIIFVGILWGLTVLIRSSFAISFLLMASFIVIYRRKLFEGFKLNRMKRAVQYVLLFLVGFLIAVAPWIIRNKITMNTFTLATQGGFTFWAGSNPDATGTWYHNIVESNSLFKIEDEVLRDKEFYKQGIEYAAKNPHKYFITGIKKIGYLFSSERMILLYFAKTEKGQNSTEVYRSINPLLIALVNIPYFIIMLIGTWGLLAFEKKRFFIYGFILTWCLTFFIFVALARYHYVLIPFFVLGTVKFLSERKTIFKKLDGFKIASAIVFNVFLLVVWFIEFYLLITK
ncbi:MAG TPA: hypothetical protein VIL99_17655 [Ignavibacteria bacterium]